jgi:beta-glucuronidase
MFDTHHIRKTWELSDSLWDFRTLPEQGEGISRKAAVPGCWESDPDTISYRGRACYERTITCTGNIRLVFKGVSHTAQVWLDDEEIANHYNAYTPFEAICRSITGGEHRLKVIADNSFGPQSALHIPNDYQSYGGITRPVVLEEIPDTFLTGLHFTPSFRDGQWFGKVGGTLRNLSETAFFGRVNLYLDGKEVYGGAVSADPESAGSFEWELSFGQVKEWSPESPNLYTLGAVLLDSQGKETDDLIDRVGFREIQISGKDILLNGQKIKIKGLCRHEEHPHYGCSIPFKGMVYDLALMKELGANSVRTVHYPNDELFLDLCDETGLLVWEENHARGLSEENMRNPNFERQCEDCIKEMIEAHYNHPSIYIWGILNECASHTEYGKSCYQQQYDLIKELDQSRPRSSASCQFKTDVCFGFPEVVSYNIYPLWYHDTPPAEYLDDLYQWVQTETEGAGKPFLITEVGAGGIYGYRTPANVKWSEEYQAETLEKQLKAIFSQDGCSGVYIWQFCDGRVSDSWFGGRPRTMNNKGVVDEYRRPKLSYEVVKRIFHEN